MDRQTDVIMSGQRPPNLQWGAIAAGLLVAAVCGTLLNILGAGLGLVAATPEHLRTLSIAAILWYIISGSSAMYIGGWTTGFFSHTTGRLESAMYGALTWAFSTLVGFVMAASGVTMVASGAAGVVSSMTLGRPTWNAIKAVSSAGKTAAEQLMGEPQELLKSIEQQASHLFDRTLSDPQHTHPPQQLLTAHARWQLMQNIRRWLEADRNTVAEQAEQAIIDLLVQHSELSRDQVKAIVADWKTYYRHVKQHAQEQLQKAQEQTKEMAFETSRTLGTVLIGMFLVLLSGGLAASYGSQRGARSHARDRFVTSRS